MSLISRNPNPPSKRLEQGESAKVRTFTQFIRSFFARKPEESTSNTTEVERLTLEFIDEFDHRLEIFRLNPDLPEFQKIRREARSYVERDLQTGVPSRRMFFGWLNPWEHLLSRLDDVFIIRPKILAFRPSSLIGFFVGDQLWDLGRLTVNANGIELFDTSDRKFAEYRFVRTARLGYIEEAEELIKHLTGESYSKILVSYTRHPVDGSDNEFVWQMESLLPA